MADDLGEVRGSCLLSGSFGIGQVGSSDGGPQHPVGLLMSGGFQFQIIALADRFRFIPEIQSHPGAVGLGSRNLPGPRAGAIGERRQAELIGFFWLLLLFGPLNFVPLLCPSVAAGVFFRRFR